MFLTVALTTQLLCCSKLLKRCYEEALRLLKRPGTETDYCTTLHHRAVSLPNLAFVSSHGPSRFWLHWSHPGSPSKAARVSSSEPRAPLPPPKVFAIVKPRGSVAPGGPNVRPGRPALPRATSALKSLRLG